MSAPIRASRGTHAVLLVALAVGLAVLADPARAWGDEGHQVIALVADHYLQPMVRAKVAALLASDTDPLTAHDLPSEATWADRFRDSDRNTTKVHYSQTRAWHFVDIELKAPDVDAACFGHPPLPASGLASGGAAQDCVVDKIDEFAAELRSPTTSAAERLLALKFLLHFVGDVHQPLHSADDQDAGGNMKTVRTATGAAAPLHHYWDSKFIKRLGPGSNEIAASLILRIVPTDAATWRMAAPTDWAREAFLVAKAVAYGELPAPQQGVDQLSQKYEDDAAVVTALQLSRAGVRLADILNRALGP